MSTPNATTAGSPPGYAKPNSASPPSSKTSTTVTAKSVDFAHIPAGWTSRSCCPWLIARGSVNATTSLSPDPPAPAKPTHWPTGTFPSADRLACALGHKACREGFSVQYHRTPRLFQELARAKGDGRYPKLLTALAKTDLLILDDWATAPLTDEQRRDLFEITEDRYDRRATLIAAQMPLKHWHETIGDPTLADAILDRLIHNAHKITLKGESMRKRKSKDLTSSRTEGTKNKES